ncbi:MAG: FAD-dependent oxidoreductase [Ruthenibacterium sp.]
MKILIVGGVAGGATAAARLRRLDETAEIIMFERGGFVSYANCGLPYYIGGEIKKKSALTLQTPESFWARFHIDVRVHHEVTAVNTQDKNVTVRLPDGTTKTESYDKLILSPGAKAIRPPFVGIDNPHVFTLRTVEDTLAIRNFIDTAHPKKATVVGGGFIGLEMAENLLQAGIETTMIQLDPQVLLPLDYDMASEVHNYLRSKNLTLKLSTKVESFAEKDGVLWTQIVDGAPIASDFVILAIGVAPDTAMAKAAGLTLGIKGSIVVNDRMETSAPDVYAVGDAVEVRHFVTGEKALISLAGPANKQGRIAADNICGGNSTYKGSQGSSVIKLFDMTVATTGINEKMAQMCGIAYDKVVTYSASHATYYPGATNLTLKTLFAPKDGKILGAEIVGFDGVDKRIDVLATAIRAGMTGEDLAELDLAYAPPYSSAKDPVNMAGFVIENLCGGIVKQYHWNEVADLPTDGSVTILDVRNEAEFSRGHLAHAVLIPLDVLREHLAEIPKEKPVYVNCHSGLRSYIACRILAANGFDCRHLSGGYRFYANVLQDKCYDATPTHPCGLAID